MGLVPVFQLEYDINRAVCLNKKCDTMFSDEFTVTTTKNAYDILEQVFYPSLKAEEHMYLIACDSAGHVKGLFVVSHGGINGTLLNIQGIFTRALLCNASGIIVAHNHPSGVCNISKEDEACFRILKDASNIMGVTLLDYMVLGNGEYASFKKNGLL